MRCALSRTGSFRNASDLLRPQIRAAGEARGFAATRLLTHWAEVVGPDLARLARPKDIRFPRAPKGGARRGAPPEGATLILEVLGPAALRVEMERERIRERVNATYGYAAVAAIRLRQVGPQGFSAPTPALRAAVADAPEPVPEVEGLSEVGDTRLRLALEALAANVLRRTRPE